MQPEQHRTIQYNTITIILILFCTIQFRPREAPPLWSKNTWCVECPVASCKHICIHINIYIYTFSVFFHKELDCCLHVAVDAPRILRLSHISVFKRFCLVLYCTVLICMVLCRVVLFCIALCTVLHLRDIKFKSRATSLWVWKCIHHNVSIFISFLIRFGCGTPLWRVRD